MSYNLKSLIEFKVVGLNQTKLISFLNRSGIDLHDIRIIEKNIMYFKIENNNYKKIIKLFKNKKIKYEILSRKGVKNNLIYLINKFGIIFSLIIFIIFIIIISGRSFKVEVQGCSYLNKDEIAVCVENYLKYVSYNKYDVDCYEVEKILYQQFDKISFVSCITRGNYIVVSIKEKLNNPETNTEAINTPFVSKYMGYVTKTNIISGTGVVKVGDFVRVGDVLIEPYVISSKGIRQSIAPRGDIEMKVFFESTVTHIEDEIVFMRTGKTQKQSNLFLFGLGLYKEYDDCKFEHYETEVKKSVISKNNLLPLYIEQIVFYETKENNKHISFSDEQEKLIEKAKQNVLSFIPSTAIIIEEHNVSTNKAGIYYVTYVVETHLTQNI